MITGHVTTDTAHRATISFGSDVIDSVNAIVVWADQNEDPPKVVAWPWPWPPPQVGSNLDLLVRLSDEPDQHDWRRPKTLNVGYLPDRPDRDGFAIFTLEVDPSTYYPITSLTLDEQVVQQWITAASSWPEVLEMISPVFAKLRNGIVPVGAGSSVLQVVASQARSIQITEDSDGAIVAGFLCKLLRIY